MIKTFRRIYPLYLFIDFLLIALSFYIPYLLRYGYFEGGVLPNFLEYNFIFILWAVFIFITFSLKHLYSTDRTLTIVEETARVVLSIFYTAIIIAAVIFFSKYKFFSRLVFLGSFFMLCLTLSVFRAVKRLILRRLIIKGFRNINVLVVGAEERSEIILKEIKKNPLWGLKVAGFLDDRNILEFKGYPVLGGVDDLAKVAKQFFIEEVIVSSPDIDIHNLIEESRDLRMGLKVAPPDFERTLYPLSINQLGMIPLISYKQRKNHPAEIALKRITDILVSLASIVILSPFLFIISLLVKINSPGPVLYTQRRCGLKGKVFNLYKFRSMVDKADSLKSELFHKNEVRDGIIFKMRDDPRITKVGKFLRKFSLDELPQIFNILKGDMSLVGPRPPTPEEVEKYTHTHMERLSVRPGLTGLSQVKGRSELTFRNWVRWDLWYINNWSFGLDLKIIWWTLPAVFKGKGAY
ncbi:MAG: exopolysaccharide biosynthesis polyprenyl glycosylphosphotransferase [Candidatus Omnitrophica bacterium]|nr:exopolysaccharide biosynthesis polyprenyl glycosylphosphotransferase [Candidatus Omnitrophota bacterium]MBD3269823.1 exopolysaccharide biosynthesis polyprenyl glycosylphosphotransferase [Candidatus Omnitrophota bacterium]